MAKGVSYRITILNWEKYNPNLKKGHKAVLISTSFLSDPKIRSLSPATKLLVLSCFLVAGESTSSQFEASHDSLVYQSGVKSGSLQSQLDLIQSLQILTYEKIDLLINRIEKKVIEKNRIEEKGAEPSNLVPLVPKKGDLVTIKISTESQVDIPRNLVLSWADTFPKEFLDIELKKARSWLLANPHKAPKKNHGRFFNNWFNRGWEKYRTTLKSNPSTISADDLTDILGAS